MVKKEKTVNAIPAILAGRLEQMLWRFCAAGDREIVIRWEGVVMVFPFDDCEVLF